MFDFLRNKGDRSENKRIEAYLHTFEASLDLSATDRTVKLSDNKAWQKIKALPKAEREKIALLALHKLMNHSWEEYNYEVIRRKIFTVEFNAKNPPSKSALLKLFKLLRPFKGAYYLPINALLFSFAYYKEHFGVDDHYMQARNAIVRTWNKDSRGAKFSQLIRGINKLEDTTVRPSVFSKKDILGKYLSERWSEYTEALIAIITHCWTSPQKTTPNKSWVKEAKKLIAQHGTSADTVEAIEDIFQFLIKNGQEQVRRLNSIPFLPIPEGQYHNPDCEGSKANADFIDNKGRYYLLEENEIGVSYLIWYAATMNVPKLNALIGTLCLTSLQKIKWYGSLSTKNGNAGMYSFTLMPEKVGIINLLNIRNKTRNKSVKTLADRHIQRKAAQLNMTEEALLELSAPTFGLTKNSTSSDFGDYLGVIDVSDLKKPHSYWINKRSDKQQKSVPAAVKEQHKEALKSFKTKQKEIKTALDVHSKRLENTYLNNIVWPIADWKHYYLDHPLLSRFTPLLIWWFDDRIAGMIVDGKLITANHQPIDLQAFSSVKLWHPIYSRAEEVMAWRSFIIDHQIQQPFKQAFREIYLLTDAERNTETYSNRFAAHILYQHQFNALAKVRNWAYSLQGNFDGFNTPTKSIPHFQLKAEYLVEGIESSLNPTNIFNQVATDQVRIYNSRRPVLMQDVPPIVFTEIMRDVDLFVGVCSIGNNPNWEDGAQDYWQHYSFGQLSETAKTRKDVLQRLLPQLKIADRCTIAGKFLIVEGKIRTYKIHMGSGNILMTPNDQYLCIVADRKSNSKKIFLPFDNDQTLAIILSKAFLLYNDDQIKDHSISRQIQF
ncbi:MAG: DUF4132 domain-containing protein [Bacteroidota bacterium]